MEIITYPNDILNKKTDKVKAAKDINSFVPAMKQLIKKNNAAGLSAPQVGISQAFFVVSPRRDFNKHEVFINPKIVSMSSDRVFGEEGCLSLPGVTRVIARPSKATIRATDEFNRQFELDLEGMSCRIFLHEYEHLIGLTLLDK